MRGGFRQLTLEIQDRSQRVLELRIGRPLLDERLDEMLGRFELLLADLRRGERVLIRSVGRLQGCRLHERRLGVVQQIHPEAHATEAQKNLRIVWIDLLRAHPIRERSLELPALLGNRRGLAQRGTRIRFERERRVVVLQRARGIVVQEIRAGEIERQLVRWPRRLADALQDLDRLRRRSVRREQHAELDREVGGHVGGGRPFGHERGRHLHRSLILPCLHSRPGDAQPRICIRRGQLQGTLEQCQRERRLSLKHVDLCEAQVRAYEPFVELNGFLEEDDAVVEALALEADRAEHRNRRRPV